MKKQSSNFWILALAATAMGTVLRSLITNVIFLQADEEIFGYDAYYLILGRSFEFFVGKIGAYIGYPLLLSYWFRLFGVSLLSARFFSVTCSAIMIFIIFITIKRITGSEKYAFIGSLLLAVLPFPLRYGHIVLTEPFVWMVLSGSVLLLVMAFEKNKWYLFTLSGFLAVTAVFIRRSALIMIFVIPAVLVWTNRSSFKDNLKQTLSWCAGFIIPLAAGIGGFLAYFGKDRLWEMGWSRIPNVSQDWKVDISRTDSFHNVIYTVQPVINKSLILVILMVVALGIILMSLHRDRWKAVYTGAFLWPAMAAVQFNDQLSELTLARIIVIPIIVLFIERRFKRDHRFYLALSIFFGSAVAFSTIQIPGDLWNVMIYTSVGAIVLIYLDDTLDSKFLRPMLWLGGLIFLIYIMNREPRIETLVTTILPIAGMTYCLGSTFSHKAPRNNHLILWGILIPVLFFGGPENNLFFIFGGFIIILGMLSTIIGTNEGRWKILAFAMPVGSILFALMIPEKTPFWGIYLPLLGTIIFMGSAFLTTPLFKRIDYLLPVTGAMMAFIAVISYTGDIRIALIATVTVGALSSVMRQMDTLSTVWKRKVPEKISILLFMMVIGYLAFYVYYKWTEVYMTEFLLQATILGSLLIWIYRSKIYRIKISKNRKRTYRPLRIRRRASVLFMIFLVASIPLSISTYLQSDWFIEEPMDQRPYMRTMKEIGDWIEDHTDEEEKILAWHCYALEADRETIIETSNAKRYNANVVMEKMEENSVNLFVRCWYTDHGIWDDQPLFQEYILNNFVIDRIIHGNECWIRTGYQ